MCLKIVSKEDIYYTKIYVLINATHNTSQLLNREKCSILNKRVYY